MKKLLSAKLKRSNRQFSDIYIKYESMKYCIFYLISAFSFKKRLIIFCLMICPGIVFAQDAVPREKLKVFIDCGYTECDYTFIRTEIKTVDFLLDRVSADVHVLITSRDVGSGGVQYQIIFYGQNKFKNSRDTLQLITSPNATSFERRDLLVHYMKIGLAPFIAKAGNANDIIINMTVADSLGEQAHTRDKWNYWVFRLGSDGSISKDQIYSSGQVNGGFSANRTTEKLKMEFGFYAGRNSSSYDYQSDDGPLTIKVHNTNVSIGHSLFKSLSDHFSYGYETYFSNNTFSNNKGRVALQSAFEYNYFSYKDVNTKLLTLSYGIQARRNSYYDTTIFEKTNEVLWAHTIRLSAGFNQKWGTVSSGIAYRNYLQNAKLYNLSVNINTEVRITGGLSFYVYLYGGIVHDQVYLPKSGASEEEVLTRRRQLASNFNFSTYLGLNYRFGSKLNNFINPRFSGAANDIDLD